VKRLFPAGVTLALLGLLAVPALGQSEEAAVIRERTIDFSDEIVEGELVRPDGDLIEGQRSRGSTSLITIREHFIDKMIQSAEDL
jgi:hypothetical protein